MRKDQEPIFPDLTNYVSGYRGWKVTEENYLLSLGFGKMIWKEGINFAYCNKHFAPQKNCECGLYAFHELEDVCLTYTPDIIGIVAASKKLEIHNKGWRAEQVEIVALALPKHSLISFRKAEKVAKKYNVPLVKESELKITAEKQDVLTLPDSLIPSLENTVDKSSSNYTKKRSYNFSSKEQALTNILFFNLIFTSFILMCGGYAISSYPSDSYAIIPIVAATLLGVYVMVIISAWLYKDQIPNSKLFKQLPFSKYVFKYPGPSMFVPILIQIIFMIFSVI